MTGKDREACQLKPSPGHSEAHPNQPWGLPSIPPTAIEHSLSRSPQGPFPTSLPLSSLFSHSENAITSYITENRASAGNCLDCTTNHHKPPFTSIQSLLSSQSHCSLTLLTFSLSYTSSLSAFTTSSLKPTAPPALFPSHHRWNSQQSCNLTAFIFWWPVHSSQPAACNLASAHGSHSNVTSVTSRSLNPKEHTWSPYFICPLRRILPL